MANYKTVTFNVSGMHCTSCSSRLEKKLHQVSGVSGSTVNFASSTALVQFDPSKIKEDQIITAGNSTGYIMSLPDTEKTKDNTIKKSIAMVVISWLITLVLAVPMLMGHHINTYAGIVLAGLTILIPGFGILKSAFSSLRERVMGMDVLIALGAIAAWISAVLPLLGVSMPDYSMTAAMLIAINLTGRLIEYAAIYRHHSVDSGR